MSPDAADGGTPEERFAARFRQLREAHGLSQGDAAAEAKDLGLPLHQQTIAKIEGGKRPLRLDEAEVLAQVVHSPLSDLLQPVMTDAELRERVKTLTALIAEQKSVAAAAEEKLRDAQWQVTLAGRADTAARTRLALYQDKLEATRARLTRKKT